MQEKFFLLPRRSSIVHRLCACGCLLRAEAAGHTKKRAWASFFYPHFFPVGHCLFLSGYIKKKVLPQELRVFAPTMKEVQRTVKKKKERKRSHDGREAFVIGSIRRDGPLSLNKKSKCFRKT